MAQLLLKITANLSASRSKDGQKHTGVRYIPWFTPEEFAKDPEATLASFFERSEEARKAKKISGITTTGEVVTDKPYIHDGIGATGKGATRSKLGLARIVHFLGKGATLSHQQEMQTSLATKYGDPTKMKAEKANVDNEEEAL